MDDLIVLGAGTYGLVAARTNAECVKLFYEADAPVQKEAAIQEEARRLLLGIVTVPRILACEPRSVTFRNKKYLQGFTMDRIPLVADMPSATHILLGYTQDDVDTEWPRDSRHPLSAENPTRGFHASPQMMEAIWQDEGRTDTIESVAYTMGHALAILIRGGIVPYDLEWIYGGDGQIHLIDFGLCDFGHVEPERYLNHVGSWGLGGDYYIPHKGHRGYEAFLEGFATN